MPKMKPGKWVGKTRANAPDKRVTILEPFDRTLEIGSIIELGGLKMVLANADDRREQYDIPCHLEIERVEDALFRFSFIAKEDANA